MEYVNLLIAGVQFLTFFLRNVTLGENTMAAQLDLTVVGNAVDVARHDAIIQAIAGAAAAEAEAAAGAAVTEVEEVDEVEVAEAEATGVGPTEVEGDGTTACNAEEGTNDHPDVAKSESSAVTETDGAPDDEDVPNAPSVCVGLPSAPASQPPTSPEELPTKSAEASVNVPDVPNSNENPVVKIKSISTKSGPKRVRGRPRQRKIHRLV